MKEKVKSVKRLNTILILSLVFNVVLFAGIMYVGVVKTSFFKRQCARIGLCEMSPQESGNYWCIKGWTNTIKKLNLDIDVVFFGNSITCGGQFQDYFPDVKTCNLGYPGDELEGMLLRVEQIKTLQPKKLFVMAGINGLYLKTDKVFEEKYQRLVDSIRESVPETEVYLQSILPICKTKRSSAKLDNEKIKRSNEIIREIAERSNCVYVDLFSLYEENGQMPERLSRDGVHLFPEAYSIWADAIRQYVE